MRPILRCVLLQNEVLQSPIRIKMISVAIRQAGSHPWQLSAPLNNQYPGTIVRKTAGIAVRITLISEKMCEIVARVSGMRSTMVESGIAIF